MTAADRLVSLGLVEAGYTFLNLDGRWPANSTQALGCTCCSILLSNNRLASEDRSMHQSAAQTAVCSTCIPSCAQGRCSSAGYGIPARTHGGYMSCSRNVLQRASTAATRQAL